MRCPYCNHDETKVLETRETGEETTRRRRECLKCSKRFTTYEQVEIIDLTIVKKDGKRERFDRQKIIKGMLRAAEKRPISRDQIEEIASEIETMIRNHKSTEVRSNHIGEMIMRRLKKLDKVAYIRFASVYRDFTDIDSFEEELKTLLGEQSQHRRKKEQVKSI